MENTNVNQSEKSSEQLLPNGVAEAISIQSKEKKENVEQEMSEAIKKMYKMIDDKIFLLQHENEGLVIDSKQTSETKDKAKFALINAMLNKTSMDEIEVILNSAVTEAIKHVDPKEQDEAVVEESKESKLQSFLEADNQRFYDRMQNDKNNQNDQNDLKSWEEKEISKDFAESLINNGIDYTSQFENAEEVIRDLKNNFEQALDIEVENIEDEGTKQLVNGVITAMSAISIGEDNTIVKGQEEEMLKLFDKMYLLSSRDNDISRSVLTKIADGFGLDIKDNDGQIDLEKFYKLYESEEMAFYGVDEPVQKRSFENAKQEADWLIKYNEVKEPVDSSDASTIDPVTDEKFKMFCDIFFETDSEKYKTEMFNAVKENIGYVDYFIKNIEKVYLPEEFFTNYQELDTIITSAKQAVFNEAFETKDDTFDSKITSLAKMNIEFVNDCLSKRLEDAQRSGTPQSQTEIAKIMRINEIVKSVYEEQEQTIPRTNSDNMTPEEQMARDKKFMQLWRLVTDADISENGNILLAAVKGDISFAKAFYNQMQDKDLAGSGGRNISQLPQIIEEAKKEVFTELVQSDIQPDNHFVKKAEMLAEADVGFVNTSIKDILNNQGETAVNIQNVMAISQIAKSVSSRNKTIREENSGSKEGQSLSVHTLSVNNGAIDNIAKKVTQIAHEQSTPKSEPDKDDGAR